MITTRIQDPRDPTTRKILKTASSLGIRRYRRDGEKWEGSRDPLKRIAELQGRIRELALLNKEYGLFAGMHNHSDSIWGQHLGKFTNWSRRRMRAG
jgi:hypothetical protein